LYGKKVYIYNIEYECEDPSCNELHYNCDELYHNFKLYDEYLEYGGDLYVEYENNNCENNNCENNNRENTEEYFEL
jgi:hypothetical protein